MAQETALYRDDVEQVRRRWAEWRNTHAVRSRLPEELGCSGRVGPARWDRCHGAGTGCG
jgi:hypothetical protein